QSPDDSMTQFFRHRFLCRKKKHKTGASARCVLHADEAVVLVHDLGNNGQPQSYAGLLGGDEWIEYLLTQLRRNPRTCVLDSHFHSLAFICLSRRNFYAKSSPFASHGLVSILHQIDESLLAKILIQRRRQWLLRIFALYFNPAAVPLV